MGFQFDFGGDRSDEHDSFDINENTEKDAGSLGNLRQGFPAKQVLVELYSQPEDVFGEIIQCSPSTTMFRRSVSDVKFQIASTESLIGEASNELVQSIEQQSDLITGVYEGGLKTWECSIDLVEYLEQTYGQQRMSNLRILELGCGSALPGIYCLRLGAHVDFQDYNEPVIHMITIPNILLNTSSQPTPDLISPEGTFETELVYDPATTPSLFFSGDWGNMLELMQNANLLHQYDIVLTSESIYEAKCQKDLFSLIKGVVRPGGIALVAAKSVYFGCSGSLNDFCQLAEASESCKVDTVAVNATTVRREITRFTFREE
ncbi:hypothetical protein BASA61_006851 [Batrachochytrium salamandrivorans]|nr:hypothetical protein BASA60_008747 [Batrachochytrium salamandrivorans]KAH6585416.1 hypothetical protein BASA61_006851 [Batrachochytrium salamandrivorans]